MTTSLQSDPRRTAQPALRKPGRLPLEMPVLFQLADLSPPQKAPPKVPLPAPLVATIEPQVTPEIVAPAPPIAPVREPVAMEPSKVTPVAKVPTPAVVGSPPIEVTHLPEPELTAREATSIDSSEDVPAECKPEKTPEANAELPAVSEPKVELPVVSEIAVDPPANSTLLIEQSATDVTPPQELTAPTPRERTGQRAKNKYAVPGSNSEWMRTHGKFIAVGFVIALIATIYMSRNGDEPAPANPNAAAASAEADQAGAAETAAQVDTQTAKEAVSASQNHLSPTLDETSPASSQANLSPPKSANTIHEPEPDAEVADVRSLFPWKGTVEARNVGKPESAKQENAKPQAEAAAIENLDSPHEGVVHGSRTEEPSVYGPPVQNTSPREEVQQTRGELPQGKSPGAYPETNPGTYRDFAPSSQPSPAPRTSPRASPASYEPGYPNNVPPPSKTGNRYERIGSGVY
jgi:hypothetical protein